jgi:hypothetical protein
VSRAIFRKIDELDEAGRIHVLPLEDVGLATWVKQIDTEARETNGANDCAIESECFHQ